jgi:hypothetical protein
MIKSFNLRAFIIKMPAPVQKRFPLHAFKLLANASKAAPWLCGLVGLPTLPTVTAHWRLEALSPVSWGWAGWCGGVVATNLTRAKFGFFVHPCRSNSLNRA